MWLTGFDVPAAHTMYLDKPLAGHNLMQAIARVKRVYGEKPDGLVVDLIGLTDQLADALATYANATGESDKPIKELQDEAIPAMLSAFELLRVFSTGSTTWPRWMPSRTTCCASTCVRLITCWT